MSEEAIDRWLKSNWQVLSLLVMLVVWGVRLESRAEAHVTEKDVIMQQTAVIQLLNERFDAMEKDLDAIREDVAFLRGQHAQENAP